MTPSVAADLLEDEENEAATARLRKGESVSRPVGSAAFLVALEARTRREYEYRIRIRGHLLQFHIVLATVGLRPASGFPGRGLRPVSLATRSRKAFDPSGRPMPSAARSAASRSASGA